MAGFVRLGGHGEWPFADGETGGQLEPGSILRVTWSIAEGQRGRRWRSWTDPDGIAVLLETGPDGRPARLEMGARDGLLTLHPGDDGRSLHGNVVTPGGVEHLALEWSAAHELVVPASPVVLASIAVRLAGSVPIGGRRSCPAVAIPADLAPRTTTWLFERVGPAEWRTGRDGGSEPQVRIALDPRGAPQLDSIGRAGERATTWELERD